MSCWSGARMAALACALVCGVLAIPMVSVSAAPGDPAIPGLAMTVQSGTNLTTFALNLPAGTNGCPGNGAADGFRWQQYLVSAAVNPGTLTYNASGPVLPAGAPAGSIAQPLYNTSGSPQVNKTTIGAAAPYTISGTSTLNLDINRQAGLINGEYRMGFACTNGGITHRFWETPITITGAPTAPAASLNFGFGFVPDAPTAVTAIAGDAQITGTFVDATVDIPITTSYTVAATPVSGGPPVSVAVSAGPSPLEYSIPGVVNGTLYALTVTATNAIGAGTPSHPVWATPSVPMVAPAPVVVVENGAWPLTVSWLPSTGTPTAGATLTGHRVSFDPVGTAQAIAPVTVPAGTNTISVTGGFGDFYVVRIVGEYSNGQVTEAGLGVFGCVCTRVIVEDITTARPQGALVLTQRCGVYGSAVPYSDSVFGALPLLPATAGADPDNDNLTPADPTDDFYDTLPGGAAPKNDSAPFDPFTGVTTDDTLFGQYPYPVDVNGDSIATYPTNCGITLDTPRLITSGPAAGQYFRTTGRLAQLTVVNTQNIDGGWTLNGTMGNFSNGTDTFSGPAAGQYFRTTGRIAQLTVVNTQNIDGGWTLNGTMGNFSNGTDTFSGNHMGWDPEVTWDSLANLNGYDMEATAGGRRQPVGDAANTGLGESFNATNPALASSLAQSSAGSSLGMAVMDARLRLLVPVAADSGVYKGSLTFTIV